MKLNLVVLFLIFAACNIKAQTTVEPLQLNRNVLVHSAGLPEEFLLFTTDSATQILFNPARANNYSTGFIYINYLSDYVRQPFYYGTFSLTNSRPVIIELPVLAKGNVYSFPSLIEERYSSSKNPTISAASLINAGNVKWLFILNNGTSMLETDDNIFYNVQKTSGSFYETEDFGIKQNRKQEAALTTLKVSGIWSSGTKNYSAGIFGIMNVDNQSVVRGRYQLRYQAVDVSPRYHFNYESKELIERNNKVYAAGIEFTFNTEKSDYVGSFSFQKRNDPQKSGFRSYRSQTDSTFTDPDWQVNGNELIVNLSGRLKSNPSTFTLNNYFSHLVNWITPSDNIFISANGFYTSADKNYEIDFEQMRKFYSGNVITSSDTSIVFQLGNPESKIRGVDVSLGYALNLSVDELFFLSGIRLMGFYRDIEDVAGNLSGPNSFVKFMSTIKSAVFTLPVYISYSPAAWVSVFGGFNYTYLYLVDKTNFTSDLFDYSTFSGNLIGVNTGSFRTSAWQSQKSIYLGCELRHNSGFKVQFFFNDDFTQIRNWNVSAGYHF